MFQLRALESELHEYIYYIEAETAEEAEEEMRAGGFDYANHKYLSGEIVKVDVTVAEEGGKN